METSRRNRRCCILNTLISNWIIQGAPFSARRSRLHLITVPYDVAEYKVVGLNVLFPLNGIKKLSNIY